VGILIPTLYQFSETREKKPPIYKQPRSVLLELRPFFEEQAKPK